jgi:Ran GTPase-activating protein (RanGAP) involved in mRNA processing and transport
VRLDEQKLIDQDMNIVVKQAMINKQCTKLSLIANSITPNGALILANGLENNSTLEKLNLLDNRIGDIGVRCLTKPLSINNTVLKTLHLGRNGITDDGAEYLAQMLKTNKTLTHLFLYTNEITNEGVAMLTNAIQNHNNTLECLNLSDNKLMNDSSADFLIEMIKHTRSLKTLLVHYCNLSKDSEETLRKVAQSNKNIKVSVNSFWSFFKNFRSEM